MSFTNPNIINPIERMTVTGVEAEFVKMFDPPTVSPPTPELVDVTTLPIFPFSYDANARIINPSPRANPVPEVMEALGLGTPSTPHTLSLDLLNGLDIVTWDNRPLPLHFMTIRDKDFGVGGTFPGPTVRVPRGVVFHADTAGKGPPPHTIHWHGVEPSPMNDGVGHCSMEIGKYLYQFQANFIGSYFYHCHRNTVQHFEFGLYGFLVAEPPDAYFSSIASVAGNGTVTLNAIPVGASSDGRFRVAANVLAFPADIQAKFLPGFVAGDSTYGVGGPGDVGVNHPHAFTVPYDVEAIWVADDRDSRWSDMAPNARQTFPVSSATPGVNDNFAANFIFPLPDPQVNFFAFNDFHADYWFITGVPVPTPPGGTAAIPPNITIPAAANSGRGMRGPVPVEEPGLKSQVSVNAQVGQTILLRCLDAAYNNLRVTLPVDAVIIAWDGRPLGVPPFGRYNHPFVVPKNTPMTYSVARRFDALIKAEAPTPSNTFAKLEFLETRGNAVTATALIPFTINP